MTQRILLGLVMAALLVTVSVVTASATTIIIVNTDAPNEGFNDPMPATPVGGNSGTTLGQQRLNVFQEAANIWGATIQSEVTIKVESSFDALSCTATSAVLGSAGPKTVESDFNDAPLPGTWYVAALANKLSGRDLDATTDDLRARFNSSLGGVGCLEGRSWYYGFDHNEGSNGVDLLAVVLHEFGHGLGFLSLVDDQTGDFLAEQPDVYARNLKDETTGRSWVDMTPAERVTSSTNNGNVTWTGPAVTVMASTLLQKRAELAVTAPLGSQATYDVGEAQFGAALTTPGIAGLLVNAVDGASPFADACGPLTNGFAITGNIAVIDRGTCNFTAKAINAQDAGAIGVVIVNNAAGPAPGMSGVDQRITIPVVSVSQADGGVLRGQMSLGPVTALIGRSTTRVAGAHASGNVQLYAPNPYQSGSSISHFDVSATPNLLMEPAISSDLTSSLDLTRSLFQDLGWFPEISAVNEPPVASFRLGANYPNPFRSSTSISFNLDSPGDASISVFDVTGRLVTKLVNGHLSAGEHEVRWDGRDGRGRQVSPGIYFYRLTAGGRTEAKRMVLAG